MTHQQQFLHKIHHPTVHNSFTSIQGLPKNTDKTLHSQIPSWEYLKNDSKETAYTIFSLREKYVNFNLNFIFYWKVEISNMYM